MKWKNNEIELICNYATAGKTPTEIAALLSRSVSAICKKYKKLGFLSHKQELIAEQKALTKIGKRRCYKCRGTLNINEFRLTFDSKYYARACRKCESTLANARHHTRMANLDLLTAVRYKLYQARYRSLKKKRVFQISIQDVENQWKHQNGRCYYTGLPMTIGIRCPTYFSIDRKDSALPYTPDNIVLCCHKINIMKGNSSIGDFQHWCRQVASYIPDGVSDSKLLE